MDLRLKAYFNAYNDSKKKTITCVHTLPNTRARAHFLSLSQLYIRHEINIKQFNENDENELSHGHDVYMCVCVCVYETFAQLHRMYHF